jgi:hypothetical protein
VWRYQAITLIGLVRSPLHSYQQDSTLEAMLNSGMETMHNHQGTLRLFLPPEVQEEKVIQWFHGIDRHKKISAISVAPLFWLLFYPA